MGLRRVVLDVQCDVLRMEIVEGNRNRARRGKRVKNDEIDREMEGVIDLTEDSVGGSDNRSDVSRTVSSEEQLLEEACRSFQAHPPQNHTATTSGIYQCIYQSILHRHIRYQAPVFIMPMAIRLGSEYGLHFFEPRYRVLISEVMSSFSVSARRGERISPVLPGSFPNTNNRCSEVSGKIKELMAKNDDILSKHHLPTFIHAHQSPLRPNTPVTIVQVRQCRIQPDGSADVFLEPVGYMWLEQIWERPGTGGLVEARGIRMGKEASDSYEMWCAMSGFGRGDGRGWGQMLPIP